MHHMFQVFDILDLILAQCERPSLARLVRVRQFHEIAVAHLWNSLSGLDKLMGTLPDNVLLFEILNNSIDYHKCAAHRPLIGCDWGTFTHYARYVQTLTVNTKAEDLGFLRFAALSKPMRSVLPSLLNLTMTVTHESTISLEHCTLLLSDNLKVLDLKVRRSQRLPHEQAEMQTFLICLAGCSSLTELAVEADFIPDSTARELAVCIQRLQGLEAVKVVPTEHDRSMATLDVVLQPLAQLPHLGSLSLPFETSESENLTIPCSELPRSLPWFTALERVRVHSTDTFRRLFRGLRNVPLVSVVFEPDSPNGPQELAKSLSMLSSCCSSTLRTLEIFAGRSLVFLDPILVDLESFALTDKSLVGLLSFEHLFEVTILHHVHMAITDRFLAGLATALPKLRLLCLQSLHTFDREFGSPVGNQILRGRPLVTKHGLAALAHGCADLDKLAIRYDASEGTIHGNDDLPIGPPSPSPLRFFDVGLSWLRLGDISDYTMASLWINELFPVVELVSPSPYNVDMLMWNTVNELIPALRKGCKRERERCMLMANRHRQ